MSKSRQFFASGTGRSPAQGASPAAPRCSRLARAVSAALNPMIPILSCALPGLALAAPRGGEIVDGAATISQPDAATTLIEQSSNQLAIDWQRFSIGADEYVRFVQPDAGALALNRVVGGNPSQILGKLSANGQVFLVNPNGIYFGHGATVDVGGLVASVFDIDSDDFLRGDYVFTRGDGLAEGVGVVNDGHISAADGGYVALLGDRVANHGVIATRLGSVALASGRQITLDLDYRGLVSLAVDEAAVGAIAGIHNSGEIAAAGGRVMLRASVANDLIDTVINNEGAIAANSIVERDGVVYLAASGGDIDNSGLLDASAASGSGADGGRVLVHTDAGIANAAGASIRASGDGSGDGGMVRVIAEGHMGHQAGAEIVADSERGRGGLVEVSGHGSLALRGEVTVGAGGHVLIDPATLTLLDDASRPLATTAGSSAAFVGQAFVASQLNNGVDITLVASDRIESTTSAAFTLTATNAGAGNLTLAIGTLAVGSGTLAAGAGGTCALDGFCVPGSSIRFTPGASGSIDLANIGFDLAGGLTVAGGTASGTVDLGDITAVGDIAISGANVNIVPSGARAGIQVNTPGLISIDAGNLVVAGAVTVQTRNLAIRGNNLTISEGNLTALDAFRASMDGAISITGAATNIDAAAVFLSAIGDLTVQPNNLVVGGGTVNGVVGDSESIDFMVAQGAVRPTTANPNAKMVSGGVLTLENLTLQSDVPYLWLEADTTNIVGSISAAQSDLLVQYSPHTLDATIGVEGQAAQGSQQVNYGKVEHFDVLPGTTVIIGSSQHRGDVAIGQSGSVDIGGQNLVAVTARRVDGLQNVISTGIVAQLLTAGGVEIPPETPYVSPVISEIEFEQLIRVVTDQEEEDSRKRLVSSEEEEPNMCEAS